MKGSDDREGAARQPDTKRYGWIVFWTLGLTIAAYLFYLGHDTTFFRDDWDIVLKRDGNSFDTYMWSHGGQEIPGQVLVYIAGMKLFGFESFAALRLVTLPLLLGLSAVTYVIGRRRMGPWGALAPALVILLMGDSYFILLWPLETMTFGGVAFLGIAAFLALEKRTTAGDLGASLLLLIAVSLSGFSLPFLAGAAVGILFVTDRDFKRLWVPIVPALAYLLWAHFYGSQGVDLVAGLPNAPDFIWNMADSAIQGVSGFSGSLGTIATIATLTFIVLRLFQLRGQSLLAWQATVTLLAFWMLTALARVGSSDPRTARYIFPGAALIILILVAVAPRGRFRTAYPIVALVLTLISLPHSFTSLREGADHLRTSADYTRAEYGASEIGREAINRGDELELTEYPMVAGSYFKTIDLYGSSPGLSPKDLESDSEAHREAADRLLFRAERIDGDQDGDRSNAAYLASRGLTCRPLSIGKTVASPDLGRRPLIALAEPDQVVVTLGRFATEPQIMTPVGGDAGRIVLAAPTDAVSDPSWRGTITAIARSVRACGERK